MQALGLEEPIQDFCISGKDRRYDRVIRVNSDTRFGQASGNLGANLIADGRQIDRADVDRDTTGEILVQARDSH